MSAGGGGGQPPGGLGSLREEVELEPSRMVLGQSQGQPRQRTPRIGPQCHRASGVKMFFAVFLFKLLFLYVCTRGDMLTLFPLDPSRLLLAYYSA